MTEFDPALVAWTDQFGALLRDKVREMQSAIVATGWNNVTHTFQDPFDHDDFYLSYTKGEYVLTHESTDHTVVLNIEALGVNRRA